MFTFHRPLLGVVCAVAIAFGGAMHAAADAVPDPVPSIHHEDTGDAR